ncbi:MAG: hypothetical protein HY735_33135 [Verrucomicrobia bacterium]|nr:hypothetical protein [Verrucomicrobiota bacterium]
MSLTAAPQEDLNFSIEQPDWVALKMVLRKIEEDIRQRRKHLLMKLSNWFLAIEMLREFEDNHLFGSSPSPRDAEYHRVFLTQLLGWGEGLLLELKRSDVDPKHIGLVLDDVEACVAYLRDCYGQWYTDLTPQQKADILRECFGEA